MFLYINKIIHSACGNSFIIFVIHSFQSTISKLNEPLGFLRTFILQILYGGLLFPLEPIEGFSDVFFSNH